MCMTVWYGSKYLIFQSANYCTNVTQTKTFLDPLSQKEYTVNNFILYIYYINMQSDLGVLTILWEGFILNSITATRPHYKLLAWPRSILHKEGWQTKQSIPVGSFVDL